jgi:hypothetical protein
MTIRTVALCLVGVVVAFGAAIAASGDRDCSDQNPKLESRSSAIAILTRGGKVQNPLPDGGSVNGAMRVGGNRIEYRENGELIGVDRLGSDSQLARRDILVDGVVHAYEFFTEGRLVRRQILAANGTVVCTAEQGGIIGPPILMRRGGY